MHLISNETTFWTYRKCSVKIFCITYFFLFCLRIYLIKLSLCSPIDLCIKLKKLISTSNWKNWSLHQTVTELISASNWKTDFCIKLLQNCCRISSIISWNFSYKKVYVNIINVDKPVSGKRYSPRNQILAYAFGV